MKRPAAAKNRQKPAAAGSPTGSRPSFSETDPIKEALLPYVVKKKWLDYTNMRDDPIDSKKLVPHLPMIRDLKKIHDAVSFSNGAVAEALRTINKDTPFHEIIVAGILTLEASKDSHNLKDYI